MFGWSILASALFSPVPIMVLPNDQPEYSLLNSVHFHPWENIFCVAHTHNNRIFVYKIDEAGQLQTVQVLKNPEAHLRQPQHAAFSPDGQKLVVANWKSQTLNVYPLHPDGFFSLKPISISPSLAIFRGCKPHGVAFSLSGKYLVPSLTELQAILNGPLLFFETSASILHASVI